MIATTTSLGKNVYGREPCLYVASISAKWQGHGLNTGVAPTKDTAVWRTNASWWQVVALLMTWIVVCKNV